MLVTKKIMVSFLVLTSFNAVVKLGTSKMLSIKYKYGWILTNIGNQVTNTNLMTCW